MQTQDTHESKPKVNRFVDPVGLLDRIRNEKLIKLACGRFDSDLADAELKILRDSASSIAPSVPSESGPRPEVRAEFIRWLVTDQEASALIDPKGFIVQGVAVSGTLDLLRCRSLLSLSFIRCDFRGEVRLQFADFPSLYLWGCSLDKSLSAQCVHVRGSVSLIEVRCAAMVGFALAQIDGELDCSGAKFVGEEASLAAPGAEVWGGIRLTRGFECSGEVTLNRAHLSRSLDCTGAKFGGHDVALRASLIRVVGDVYLRNAECSGAVLLAGAQIGDFLDCSGAKLLARDTALVAHEVVVGAAVDLRRMESSGRVELSGARMGSYLCCDDAKLKVGSGDALSGRHMVVGAGVSLSGGFETTGRVCLDNTEIRGNLDCGGANFAVNEEQALSADLAVVHGSIFFSRGFQSLHTIRMVNARIGGALSCMGARLGSLICSNSKISGDFVWLGVQVSELTRLVLAGAKVKNFRDDLGSWPTESAMNVDGFEYEELTLHTKPTAHEIKTGSLPQELPLIVAERMSWIKLQPRDCQLEPQPWVWLANLFEAKGYHADAKQVFAEFRRSKARQLEWHPYQWLRRRGAKRIVPRLRLRNLRKDLQNLRHPNRALALAFAWLEEVPARILYSIAVSLIMGGLIFSHAGSLGALAPTESQAYEAFIKGRPMPAAYPALNPFVYTVENALPLVKLGQDDKWAPDPRYVSSNWLTNYWFLMWVRWSLILFGWFQATVLAAALVSRFKP